MSDRSTSVRIEGKKPGISVETGYENSSPASRSHISVNGAGVFNIRQHFEAGADEGYSFHLNVALVNERVSPTKIPLRIVWAESEYDFCRDYLYVGYDGGRE